MRPALRLSIVVALALALPSIARADERDGLPLPEMGSAASASFTSLAVRVLDGATRHEVRLVGTGRVEVVRVDEDGIRTTHTGAATRDELAAVAVALDRAALEALEAPVGSSGGAIGGEKRLVLELRSKAGRTVVVSRTVSELRASEARVRPVLAAVQAIETRLERAQSEPAERVLELQELGADGREAWSLRFDARSGELVVTRRLADGSAKTYRGVATDEEKAAIRLGLERVRFEPRVESPSPSRLVVTVATAKRDGSSGATTWTTRTRTLPEACDRIIARLARDERAGAATRGLAETVAGATR